MKKPDMTYALLFLSHITLQAYVLYTKNTKENHFHYRNTAIIATTIISRIRVLVRSAEYMKDELFVALSG